MDHKKEGRSVVDLDTDLRQILQEIEKEEAPKRLLELAARLQAAMKERSAKEEADNCR